MAAGHLTGTIPYIDLNIACASGFVLEFSGAGMLLAAIL